VSLGLALSLAAGMGAWLRRPAGTRLGGHRLLASPAYTAAPAA
jgi:hypothetical protein